MLSTLIRRREEEGFTLVELMVVILIIAILIGAAIPTFLGLRQRAQDSAAQQDLRNTLTAAKAAAVETAGVYNASVLSQLQDIEPAITFEEKNLDSETVRAAAEDDAVVVDVVGSEFVALRASESGKVFIAVD